MDYMLRRMGFGVTWRGWIHQCISTTASSVQINGSPTKLFKAYKGIQQGDPLSPFLFTIVVEALSLLLVKARELGMISGFEMSVVEKESPACNLQIIPFFLVLPRGKKLWLYEESFDVFSWFWV